MSPFIGPALESEASHAKCIDWIRGVGPPPHELASVPLHSFLASLITHVQSRLRESIDKEIDESPSNSQAASPERQPQADHASSRVNPPESQTVNTSEPPDHDVITCAQSSVASSSQDPQPLPDLNDWPPLGASPLPLPPTAVSLNSNPWKKASPIRKDHQDNGSSALPSMVRSLFSPTPSKPSQSGQKGSRPISAKLSTFKSNFDEIKSPEGKGRNSKAETEATPIDSLHKLALLLASALIHQASSLLTSEIDGSSSSFSLEAQLSLLLHIISLPGTKSESRALSAVVSSLVNDGCNGRRRRSSNSPFSSPSRLVRQSHARANHSPDPSSKPSPSVSPIKDIRASIVLNGALSPSWDRPTSAAFASYCIEASFFPLLSCTGPLAARLAALLLDQPRIILYCPSFIPKLEALLDAHQSQSLLSRGPSISGSGVRSSTGLPLAGLGASIGTISSSEGGGGGGGSAQRQHQKRMDQNREKCRDILFGILRDTSSFLSQSGIWSPPPSTSYSSSSSANSSKPENHFKASKAPNQLISELRKSYSHSNQPPALPPWFESLLIVRSRTMNLISDIQPCNIGFLSDLVVTCLMQAAATGEVLMEEAVASLARLNPSKFQRLNQRLNQSPSSSSQPSPTIPQSALRPPPPPLPPGTNHIPQHSSSARPSFPSSNAASAERLASIERLFDSLESVTRCFQSVQQPYALLVDLSDSHSFSLALHRSITSRLRSLLEAGQANLPAKHSHGSIGEKAVGISCLASFLGYLSFRHQSSLLPSPSPTLFLTTPTAPHHVSMYANEPLPRSSFISLSPPPSIDLLGLLHSFTSEGCNDVFFLAVHIPCFYSFILPYLSLCSWNQSLTPHQAVTNDHPRIMIQGIKSLMMLRSSPLLAIPLLPEATDSLSFEEFIKDKRGAAIICIRCLLDDLHQRILATFGPKSAFLPASLPPPSPSPFPSLHPPRVPPQHIVKAPETDFSPDISFMELCCPSLAISCRQLEASSARFRSSSSASSSSSAQVITDQGQEESSSHPPAVPPRRVYAHPVHFGSMMQQSLISINIGQSISSSAQQPLPPSYLEMLSSSPSSSSSVAPSTSNGNPVDPIREKLKQLFINQYSTDDTPIKMKDVLSYITENITTNILCHVMKPLPSSLNQAADAFKDMAEGESIVARAIHHGSAVTIPSEAAKALFTMGITLITSSSLQDESTGDKIKSAIVKAARDLASVVFKDALESASRACLSMLRGKQLGHKNGPIAALLPSSVPQSAVAAAASLAEKDILSILATRLWSQIQNQVQKQLISIIQRPEGNVQAVSKALSGLRLESVAEEMMEGRQAQRDDWDLMGPHSSLTDLIFSLASQSKPGQLNNALSNQLSALTCWPECVVYRSEEGRKIALALQAGLQEGRVKGPLEIESVFCWILSLGFEAEKKSLVAWAGAHFFVLCSERTIKDKVHIDAWMGKEDSNLVVMTHLPSKLISYAVETEDIDLISLIRKTLQKLSFNSVGLV